MITFFNDLYCYFWHIDVLKVLSWGPKMARNLAFYPSKKRVKKYRYIINKDRNSWRLLSWVHSALNEVLTPILARENSFFVKVHFFKHFPLIKFECLSLNEKKLLLSIATLISMRIYYFKASCVLFLWVNAESAWPEKKKSFFIFSARPNVWAIKLY